MIEISKSTYRRFILGRQGLWPGRRWRGKKGTAEAIRTCEAMQMDPLVVIARSHDIVLHSRVLDYKPEYLDQLMYKERRRRPPGKIRGGKSKPAGICAQDAERARTTW